MTLYQILLVLHIAFTAIWFGSSISTPGRIRRGLQSGDAEAKWMVSETARALRLSFIFGILTFVSGLVLVFQVGGFKHVGKNIHMSMGMVLVMIALDMVLQTIWKGAQQKFSETGDHSILQGVKGKMVMFGGMQQLLWLVVLGLMVIKI